MKFFKRVLATSILLSLFISCSPEEDSTQEMMEIVEDDMSNTNDMNMENDITNKDDEDTSEQEENQEEEENQDNNALATGTLQTNSDYPTAGNFKISNTNGKIILELDASFNVEGGLPDLVIYLSNVTDSQENAILISDTAADSGMQSIEIPTEIDFSDYKYVLLYCREFNQKVGFGEIIQNSMN